jgi:hypothetical protein
MSSPDFREPVVTPPQGVRRVRHPIPGPDETCDEYIDVQAKRVCGEPAVIYVSLPGTDAIPGGARIALCEPHKRLHNARQVAKQFKR